METTRKRLSYKAAYLWTLPLVVLFNLLAILMLQHSMEWTIRLVFSNIPVMLLMNVVPASLLMGIARLLGR